MTTVMSIPLCLSGKGRRIWFLNSLASKAVPLHRWPLDRARPPGGELAGSRGRAYQHDAGVTANYMSQQECANLFKALKQSQDCHQGPRGRAAATVVSIQPFHGLWPCTRVKNSQENFSPELGASRIAQRGAAYSAIGPAACHLCSRGHLPCCVVGCGAHSAR